MESHILKHVQSVKACQSTIDNDPLRICCSTSAFDLFLTSSAMKRQNAVEEAPSVFRSMITVYLSHLEAIWSVPWTGPVPLRAHDGLGCWSRWSPHRRRCNASRFVCSASLKLPSRPGLFAVSVLESQTIQWLKAKRIINESQKYFLICGATATPVILRRIPTTPVQLYPEPNSHESNSFTLTHMEV